MAERPRMTAAQLANKLLADEHPEVLRDSAAWMVAELMEAEVAAQIGAELGERTPDRGTHPNGSRPRTGVGLLLPHLNEQQRRLLLATEARLLGHGGVRAVAQVAKVSETTIRKGRLELDGD